jgi:Domain of unknown function (DUF6457)
VNPWLREAVTAMGGGAELSSEDARTLLDLAAHAAHESGARTNAPLLCYLVGRLQGQRDLADVADAIRRATA